MSMRIAPDKNQPSVAIEIPLDETIAGLRSGAGGTTHAARHRWHSGVSQGFRDLVDDARGILTDLLAHPPTLPDGSHFVDLDLTGVPHLEIAQLTGAICPGDEEVYRPGLWIVLKDTKAAPNATFERSGAGACAPDRRCVREKVGPIGRQEFRDVLVQNDR